MNNANLFDQNVEFLRIAFWQIILAAGPLFSHWLSGRPYYWHNTSGNFDKRNDRSFVPKLVIVMISLDFFQLYFGQLSDYFGYISIKLQILAIQNASHYTNYHGTSGVRVTKPNDPYIAILCCNVEDCFLFHPPSRRDGFHKSDL